MRRHVVAMLCGLLLCTPIIAADADDWDDLKNRYLEASRREWNHKHQDWQDIATWTFDDNQLPDTFRVIEGTWEVRDGALHASDGEPDHNRVLAIGACRWPAFRLAFDVTLTPRDGQPADRIGDVGIRLNADPETGSFAKGYAVITGQYMDQATVVYRLNIPYARTEWSPVEPGKTHRVVLEVVKPHLRFWVDGRVVLDAWERTGRDNRDPSDFLDMDPERILVLHTYDTHMTIDNLQISVPAE